MRKKYFILGVIMVISLLTLVSCGYDFEKKSTELQSLLGDNGVSYEKFMSEYRTFSAKLDEEIEKVDSKFKKTGKLEYSTRLAFLQEYYEDIHVNYIDAMVFKAKQLSGAEATTAAKEIYDSTEWKGPVCTLVSGVNGSDTLYSAHYDPSFTSLDIAPLMSKLNSYASSYDLTVNRVVDLATDKVASATGASVSSPWGMTLLAYCDATVYLEGYEVFTKNETDEYSVTIGENFTFPNAELEVLDDYGDKYYFVGWTDGYDLYKPEEKVQFDKYTETEYESAFLNLWVGDWNFWDSNNNDGYLAAGESGWIDVTICNDGNWDAEGVTVQLSSETTGVTVSSTTKNYGTIESEEESNLSTGYSTYNASYTNSSSKYQNFFTVKVDNSVANGTKAKIKVVITDNNGFKWEDYVSFTVQKINANLSLSGYYFKDDGNNDGKLNIGETAYLDVCFFNAGTDTAKIKSTQLICETPGIMVTKSTGNSYNYSSKQFRTIGGDYSSSYGNIDYCYYKDDCFSVRMPSDIAEGTLVKFKVKLTDNLGNVYEYPIEFEANRTKIDLLIQGYSFSDNGNNDGILNIGETAYFDAMFYNSGSNPINGISSKLECETPGVIITKANGEMYDYSSKQYRTIAGDYSTTKSYVDYCYYKDNCFAVKLPNTIAEGTKIKFNIVLFDKTGTEKKYPIEFEAKKHDIDLQMVDYYFKDDSNQNGELELGEVAYLDVCFYNAGKDTAKIQTTELICETPGIMVTKSTGNSYNYSSKQYRTIGGDYDGTYSYVSYCYNIDRCFSVRMPSDITEGTLVKFKVKLTDVLGNVYEYPIEFEAKKQELGVGITFSYDDKKSYEYVYAGENLELYTKVVNNSTASMAHVTVDVSTDSPYVTPSSRSRYFTSAISSKDYESISWSYSSSDDKSFKIASNTPIGTELNFKVVVSDATGKTKEVTKTFVVGPKSFNPEIIDISASAFDMNGGDKLTAGSYLYVDALFRNVGPYGYTTDRNYNYVYYGRGKDVSMKLVSSCPEITILQGNKVIGQSDSGYYYIASKGSSKYSSLDDYYGARNNMNPNAGFEMKIAADADKTKEYSFTVQVFEGSSLKAEETYTFTLE